MPLCVVRVNELEKAVRRDRNAIGAKPFRAVSAPFQVFAVSQFVHASPMEGTHLARGTQRIVIRGLRIAGRRETLESSFCRERFMVESPQEAEVNLLEFLSTRARSASDARLVLDVALGLVIAVIALVWRPTGWLFVVSAALCFAAFGGWGIADRELRERRSNPADAHATLRALGIARVIASIVGALAAGTLLIGLLAVALGTWIS